MTGTVSAPSPVQQTAHALAAAPAAAPAGVVSKTAGRPAAPPLQKEGRGAGLAFLAVLGIVYAGWTFRDNNYLSPESGVGYWLGITGAVLMLALVLYPLRKKARFMRNMGAVRHWFRAHMIQGVLGPVCILFHANFQLGSLNSRMALYAMLLVAGSGLIGRYIYRRIHYGLYGRRMTLKELREGVAGTHGDLADAFDFAPQLNTRLLTFEQRVMAPCGVFRRLARLLFLAPRIHLARFATMRFLNGALRLRAKKEGWSGAELRRRRRGAADYVSAYMGTVRVAARFGFYERLFAAWHVLHFPMFLLLILAGIVHVIAVHAY